MTFGKATRLLSVAGALICGSALAQTHFCIGGDLDHLSQSQKAACTAKMQAVKLTAAALHAPGDWHFVVVCGEEGWKSYTAFAAVESTAVLMDASADTHFEQHETFLRGDRLDLENLRSLRRVLAHEVAGIELRSKDEIAINRQMTHLLDQTAGSTGL